MTIALENIRVRRGVNLAISGVDLLIPPGVWFGVIGANGSGKTSLLRAIAGRLPFAGGACRFGPDEVSTDRAARAARCGFAPPIDRLPEALRGRDVLSLAAGTTEEALNRLGPLQEALGLSPLLSARIGECSAGMRQRLALATAFAAGSSILVLDEPFNWLDPVVAFDLKEVLRTIPTSGRTLITALQDPMTLATCCGAGVVLTGGKAALLLDVNAMRDAASAPEAFERRLIAQLRPAQAV